MVFYKKEHHMKIHGINGLSLLDYPGKMACTIFTGHCNFRCPFCHNATLVLNPDSQPVKSEGEIFELLKSRQGRLEGIAITGGEPTLNKDLADFCRNIKHLTFTNDQQDNAQAGNIPTDNLQTDNIQTVSRMSIKLDTNGSLPDVVKALVNERLVDYIAMDIKAAPDNYARAVGLDSFDMSAIFDSVDFIMESGANGLIDYEFRTTVVGGIHTENDFIKIGRWLKGAKAYFLQGYRTSGDQLAPEGLSTVPVETMEHYRELLLPYIPNTQLRGVV